MVFRCICVDGFEGENCEVNVDDCEDNDCENNFTCVDGINNYICFCLFEYIGKKNRKCCVIDFCVCLRVLLVLSC